MLEARDRAPLIGNPTIPGTSQLNEAVLLTTIGSTIMSGSPFIISPPATAPHLNAQDVSFLQHANISNLSEIS